MRNRGFTLIEIMIVITILGILVGVAVPRLTGRTEDARVSAANLQIENLGLALDAFEYDCGRYPTTSEGLQALREPVANLGGWKGPYLKKAVPLDPWKNPYTYISPGILNRDYDLASPHEIK